MNTESAPPSPRPAEPGTPLPVPDLDATLSRLETVVSAVADAPTLAATRAAVESFRTGAGPGLQRRLLDYAGERAAAGSSWLAEGWLHDYLDVRDPLPLATNVGFQVRLDSPATGLDRAADLVHRAVRLHLDHVHGRTPEEVDGRGNRLSPAQWDFLAGGVRMPAEPRDRILAPARPAAGPHEIGVIVSDRIWALRVTDDAGEALPVAALRAGLERALTSAKEVPRESPIPLPHMSYLPAAAGAAVTGALRAEPAGAAIFDRIRDMLFTVHLLHRTPRRADAALRDCAFGPGNAWVTKPVTYEIGLDTDWVCLNVEHSTVDGATILTQIARMQAAEPALPGGSAGPAAEVDPEELTWSPPAELLPVLREALESYRDRARDLAVRLVRVPAPDTSDLGVKVSADAICQLILTIAQKLAYDRVRAVYEAVDMREYVRGRTECLRAVTPEAVDFAEALVAGEAEPAGFAAVMAAHRGWVKACKSGNGMDRHLWALRRTAAEAGAEPGLFGDPGVVAARTDFLSTTSIGSDAVIRRYTFAPTVPNGFGVNYTPLDGEIEYCLSFSSSRTEGHMAFQAALSDAARRLGRFLDGVRAGA